MNARSVWWRRLPAVLFWLGIVFCLGVAWKLGPDALTALARFRAHEWAGLFVWMLAQLALSAAAWRCYVAAYGGLWIRWPTAFRHLGLLLVGKYIPGGVFGFVARLYAADPGLRSRQLAAGVSEQLIGAGIATGLGGLCYLAAWTSNAAWLAAIVLLPWLALGAIKLVFGVLARMHSKWALPASTNDRALLLAAASSLVQQMLWGVVVGWLAWAAFGASGYAALGAAGAYGIAVGAGILVLISPGGIGVREGAMTAFAGVWLGVDQALVLAAMLRLLSVGMDLIAGVFTVCFFSRSGIDSADHEVSR